MNTKPLRSSPDKAALTAAVFAACLALGAQAAHAAQTGKSTLDKAPGGARAASSSSPCVRVEMGPMVNVAVGKSTLLKPQTPVTRILLGNPEHAKAAKPVDVASESALEDQKKGAATGSRDAGRPGVADVDVVLLSPNEIYLLGKSVGSTNVVLLDRSGQCTLIDVVVGMDTAALQATLKQLLPGETNIKVSSAADSLVLTGTVSDATKVDRALDLAHAFVRRTGQGGQSGQAGRNERVVNMLSVAAPQQVMLEVKVAEISKTLLDRFGINFARAYSPADGSMLRFLSGIFGGTGGVLGQVSNTTGARVGGGIVGSTSNGPATGAFTGPIGNATIGGDTTTIPLAAGSGSTLIGIDAEKKDGLVKILAEPTVMAISGQEGSFLAGGKIFIPVAQGDAGARTITLEEKEFGVSIKFTPTVLEGGRINLVVRPEVSELNREGVGITAPGISGLAILPAFTTRKAATTVQLHDGQSFAIGGLIKNNVTTNIKAFPFLGEIPVLGALFRSSDFQTDRSELVFVVTPRLVKPLPPDYQLPTDAYVQPTRSEFFLGGKMEGAPETAKPEPRSDAGEEIEPAAAPATAAAAADAKVPSGFEVK